MHHEIAVRTADLALSADSSPRRVLDVGCGTGLLLQKFWQSVFLKRKSWPESMRPRE